MLFTLERPKVDTHIPLPLREIKPWFREREVPFLDALREYGDLRGKGRKTFTINRVPTGRFTGDSLCWEASAIILEGLITDFGRKIQARIVDTYVDSTNVLLDPEDGIVLDPRKKYFPLSPVTSHPMIDHRWVEFSCADSGGEPSGGFADGTFGQVNMALNRVVVDYARNEQAYYGYLLQPENVTSETMTEHQRKLRIYKNPGKNGLAAEAAAYQRLRETLK